MNDCNFCVEASPWLKNFTTHLQRTYCRRIPRHSFHDENGERKKQFNGNGRLEWWAETGIKKRLRKIFIFYVEAPG